VVKIAIGSDHRGVELKKTVIGIIGQLGHDYKDFGSYTADSVDYPDIAREVGEAVSGGDYGPGILICDTGIGMSIAANKVRGIRAALCRDAFDAQRARQHNDANVLCLAAGRGPDKAAEIVTAFLKTDFEGGRHQRRVDKLMNIECC